MTQAPSRCPEPDELAAWAEGSASVDGVEHHVAGCVECAAAVAEVQACVSAEVGGERPLADRYVLQTVLDQGGRGVICVARDLILGRRVAIKLARQEGERGALLREAAVQAAFQDPNVLSVLDAGHDGDHTFVVVEYVDGIDAAGACLAPTFGTADARRIIEDAAGGLMALHRAGLVHGDVTPRNLMVGHDGRTRLIDFGMATGATAGGGGTPGFTAPEQRVGAATQASDQYALGKTLAVLLRYADRRSAALERVVRRACDPDPRRRYPSVEAFARALRHPRWRNAIPAVAAGLLAILALPEQPRDLDAYFMGQLEDAAEASEFDEEPVLAGRYAERAAAIAARSGRPELELRAALLALRSLDSDVDDDAQHELALSIARLAEDVTDPGLRTAALLALGTSPRMTLESARVVMELAEASARPLPADDPRREYLNVAHMVLDSADPESPPPVLEGASAPIAAMVWLYRGFGEPGWEVQDVGCETVEPAYPRGLCFGIQAWAYVSSTEGLLSTVGSAPARRYADRSIEVLTSVAGLDDCELMFGLFVRGTTRLDAEPDAAEEDLRRAHAACNDDDEDPETLVMLRAQWARALVRTGELEAATQAFERASSLGLDDDDTRALLDLVRRELDAAAATASL